MIQELANVTDEYMSTEEVASVLGVSKKTVTNLIDRGHFPGAYKIDPSTVNSPYRIPKSEVQRYMKENWGKTIDL